VRQERRLSPLVVPVATLVDDFADLFEGRKDAYGADFGGSVHVPDVNRWTWDDESMSPWAKHLSGEEPIGVYPMVPTGSIEGRNFHFTTWSVKWGCVDFDIKSEGHKLSDYPTEGEAHDAALNLVDMLAEFGITAWIERTRSGGRHVWVFAETWVPASTMRRALHVACDLVGASTREVNPKSEGEGQPPDYLGNYVRLPYPGDQPGINERRPRTVLFEDIGGAYHSMAVDVFVTRARSARATLEQLEGLAKHYVEPPKPRIAGRQLVVPVMTQATLDAELTSKMGGLAWTIFNEGPLPDGDRSTTLARLAHLCREDGLTPDEALQVITVADLMWGKFHSRRDGERQLENMVETAFADWEYA
jgi:hypothetical protein